MDDHLHLHLHLHLPLSQPIHSLDTTTSPSFDHHRHRHRRRCHHHLRYCFLDVDDSSLDDGCLDLLLKGGHSSSLKMVEPYNSQPVKKFRKRGKLLQNADSTEVMEQQIWKELPEDLFEAVIARLPTATFFRFRLVCQKWNSVLGSHSFSKHCAEVPKGGCPWFYSISHEKVNRGAMYDPTLKKWYHPFIPDLPTEVLIIPVASAGGLVCFRDTSHRKFYVCNPLTRSFKELPMIRSCSVWSPVAVAMTLDVNSTTGGYKILLLGSNGEAEVYDSAQGMWSRLGNIPSNIKLPLALNFHSHAVSIGTTLYFMLKDAEGILSYDMVDGVWKQFVIPAPPYLTDNSLVECGGRIILVGLLSKNAATCMCIWELQKMTLLWKEVDRMPNIWCLEFYGKHVRMTCWGNTHLLMLSLKSKQTNRLVMYDVLSREWKKVPASTAPSGKSWQWLSCGTAFHPSPTAVA